MTDHGCKSGTNDTQIKIEYQNGIKQNVEQIANKKFRTNKEVVNAIVKSEINKQIGEGWREQACEIIQRSEKIYLYGVSVSETDLFWWKTLMKWFEESRSHELAIHCYLNSTNSDLEERTTAIKKVFVKSFLQNVNTFLFNFLSICL